MSFFEEILVLTKMNWNTAAFACNEPITVAFSRKLGQILAELDPKDPMGRNIGFICGESIPGTLQVQQLRVWRSQSDSQGENATKETK
jgi:hypothetical protein